MKLISTNRKLNGKTLVCEDAVFDPNFVIADSIKFNATENFVTYKYDFSECGHPLLLPFRANTINFGAKFTPHDIHINAIAEIEDDVIDNYYAYTNGFGDIEFDVRMTPTEKSSLTLKIIMELLDKMHY